MAQRWRIPAIEIAATQSQVHLRGLACVDWELAATGRLRIMLVQF